MNDSEVGYVEGDACNRNGCAGTIEAHRVENCACHINPPCVACTTPREYCETCDWEAAEDEINAPTASPASIGGRHQYKPRTVADLDVSKVSWINRSHTHFSMIKEGVYPEGLTREQVRERVDGTFGGRFKSFGAGRFEFIAYTD